MRVGLLFGSFDPLHYGHLQIASYVASWGDVDRVWLVATPQNPYKVGVALTPIAERCREIGEALARVGDERIALCDIELGLPRPSYTIKTLEALREKYPEGAFTLIVGADSLATLPQWREGERIMSEYDIIAYPRLGSDNTIPASRLYGRVRLLDAPIVEVSSTFIRRGWREGKNMNCFTPVRR